MLEVPRITVGGQAIFNTEKTLKVVVLKKTTTRSADILKLMTRDCS